MTTLVLSEPDIAEADKALAFLRDARRWVASATAGEASAARERAMLIREWTKIRKASSEIATEAVQLEATALRRLAQLGALTGIGGAHKRAALGFAALSDAEFDVCLKRFSAATASALWRAYEADREVDAATGRGRSLGRGTFSGSEDRRDLRQAARTLLADVIDRGGPTTVHAAAMQLADELDLDLAYDADGAAVLRGLKEVVKESMRTGDNWPDTEPRPRWITYFDPEAGWIHIPYQHAGLAQVEAWATYRHAQASEHLTAAKRASALVEEIKLTGEKA